MLYRLAKDEDHDYSCVMLYLSERDAKRVLDWASKNIPDGWVHEKGREDKPHVTLKYGLHTNEYADVEGRVPKGPVEVELGEVKRFTSHPERDVLYIEVVADELHEYHGELSELPNTDEHPEYKPHMTLAYVKKGAGEELEGDNPFEGATLQIDRLVWSPAEGKKQEHSLKKEAWLFKPKCGEYPANHRKICGEKRTVCVDFDGTIASYRSGQDVDIIGKPIPGVREALKKLRKKYKVMIYSCRNRDKKRRRDMKAWLDSRDIPYDGIIDDPKPFAEYYIDDKGVRFRSWKQVLNQVS